MMNGRDRPRGPPQGPPPGPPLNRGPGPQSDSNSSPSTMTRGAAFEDEKARIIKSCYAKKDEDGTCTYTGKQFLLTPPYVRFGALGNTL
jgi:hypothetical protein